MEPFGFFSVEALRAGWYLIWRQLVRVVPLMAGSVLIGYFLISRGLVGFGAFLMAIGIIVARLGGGSFPADQPVVRANYGFR
jgi:hypothetical protein